MTKGSTINKLERLDQLIGKLKANEAYTAAQLADELNVSLRTLMRDLNTLRDKGYPIEADKGRGGGVRLYPRWGVGKLTLNYKEVIDLLLAMNILEKLNSPLFLSNLDTLRNKLYASFPDQQRPRIRMIRNRILIGDLASMAVLQNYTETIKNQYTDIILESFFEQKRVWVRYKKEDGSVSEREIEVHYLCLNWPVWYLVSYDHKRSASRTFRIDRVQEAQILEDTFSITAIDDFSPEWSKYAKNL